MRSRQTRVLPYGRYRDFFDLSIFKNWHANWIEPLYSSEMVDADDKRER